MFLVGLYSVLLLCGISVSQLADIEAMRGILTFVTMICLSYIMLEVGLEFTLDKKNLKSYGWDYVVAMTAASLPWIFCAIYFMTVLQTEPKQAWLVSRFAAPTSAGVLFAMLAAAGLATTWLFKKVRILAIFDDLDTILLMIPLKIMIVGLKPQLLVVVVIIFLLLIAAYLWLHRFKLPIGKAWLLLYGAAITLICKAIEHATHVHLEVLLPAFVLGCILYNPHDPNRPAEHAHEHTHIEPENPKLMLMDRVIKGAFMFLVGCSLPKIDVGDISWGMVITHVLLLTVISNIGKCFPIFCYRKEASFRERCAVAIAMFPRGEVGAGVLLVAMDYGLGGLPATLGGLSLALNLLLTGIFIAVVIKLIEKKTV